MRKLVRSNSDTNFFTDNKNMLETMNDNLIRLKKGIKKERYASMCQGI